MTSSKIQSKNPFANKIQLFGKNSTSEVETTITLADSLSKYTSLLFFIDNGNTARYALTFIPVDIFKNGGNFSTIIKDSTHYAGIKYVDDTHVTLTSNYHSQLWGFN